MACNFNCPVETEGLLSSQVTTSRQVRRKSDNISKTVHNRDIATTEQSLEVIYDLRMADIQTISGDLQGHAPI